METFGVSKNGRTENVNSAESGLELPPLSELVHETGFDAKKQNPSDMRDPFSPENLQQLRLSQDFASLAPVRPVLTTVAVRKPHNQEFVRTRSGTEWKFPALSFVEKAAGGNGDHYLVAPGLAQSLPGHLHATLYVVAISRGCAWPFLWPCRLPNADGTSNPWWDSALEVARLAETRWVRMQSDKPTGSYIPHVAQGNLPDPTWPEVTLEQLIRLAFAERYIESPEHPVLRRLRGEL